MTESVRIEPADGVPGVEFCAAAEVETSATVAIENIQAAERRIVLSIGSSEVMSIPINSIVIDNLFLPHRAVNSDNPIDGDFSGWEGGTVFNLQNGIPGTTCSTSPTSASSEVRIHTATPSL